VRVLRGLARAVAAVLEGFAALIGVGRGSARRALMDRWDDASRRPAFPDRVERNRHGPEGGSSGWAP
jgi:hypothetical protein